jgi:hypothetical protein
MYYIIETQTNEQGQGAHIVQQADTRQSAFSKYHQVLASAAVSAVAKHGCIIINDQAQPVAYTCYKHPDEEHEDENIGVGGV